MSSENLGLIERKTLSDTKNIILYFFIYSIIGWIMEVFFVYYKIGTWENRGFLFSPMCPIYGYGALMLILSLRPYTSNKIKLFFGSIILFTVFEYLVGFGLEAFFKIQLWDYSMDTFNLNGRITLYIAIIWGFLALLVIYFIHPFIKKNLKVIGSKLSYSFMNTIFYVLCTIYVVDTIFSIIKHTIT